jgi:NAD(P)-dependent dehydrogenase (short-subunit alcohol dehydrogenase family)
MPHYLKDRTIIVTGAGSGIGLSIARQAAEAGANLVLVDIDSDRINAAAKDINVRFDTQTLPIRADCSVQEEICHVLACSKDRFGRIYGLCNNAGLTDRQRPLLETDTNIWNRILEVNLKGPYLFCREVVAHMLENGGGAIVNTLSIAAYCGGRGGFSYTVSKHGLLGMTRSIAAAYGDRGIRCNGISPGSVVTNISTGELGGEASPEAKALREKGLATRPARAQPDQIAPAAVFLLSDAAGYINGQNIVVDDGWTNY